MATQSSHPNSSQQVPAHQFPYHGQHPHGYNIQFGGHSYDPKPMNPSDAASNPYTRIAVLEKELEHCQTGKAEAEIAAQYLATLNGKRAAYAGNGDKEIAELKQQLAQGIKEKEAFEAKLQNALDIITTILTSRTIAPVLNSAAASKNNEPICVPDKYVHNGNLIDFVDSAKGFSSTSLTGNDTTLLDESCNNFSGTDYEAQKPDEIQSSFELRSADFEEEPYIPHFLANKHEAPVSGDGNVQTTSKGAASNFRGSIHAKTPTSSPDERSETSIEPGTDESSHEYAKSSDGPSSLTSSFVTAKSDINSEQDSSTKNVAIKAAGAQGVHKWNAAASMTTFEDSVPSITHQHVKQTMWSGDTGSACRRIMGDVPSWKVGELFSSVTQRDDTIDLHKREVEPGRPRFPNFFKVGLRFDPGPHECDVYRTVLISNIPIDTTLKQVLEKVRGGIIVDAKLLDTVAMISSKTALVIFLHDHPAFDYEDFATTHPIFIETAMVRVQTLPTPTWPSSPGLQFNIDKWQHTRCLEVHNFPRHVSPAKLRADLSVCREMKGDRLVHFEMGSDNVLKLQFSSIFYAGRAFGVLTHYGEYCRCKVYFVPDPCAQPLETLLEKSISGPEVNLACPRLDKTVVEELDRLSKVELGSETEVLRGRGFDNEE